MQDQCWDYRGHRCSIELDYEEDNIKAFHLVTKPTGERVWADITPYDQSMTTVNRWIDAGYPSRQGVGPLHVEDIEALLESVPLCEFCNDSIIGSPVTGEETGGRGFCSDDCLFGALDKMRVARIEAKREYELYGDDLDSWFR